MEISGFQALRSGLRDVPPRTAVVAAAHDPHTLEAVFQAQRDGLIRPLLVGERDKILRMAEDLGAPCRRRMWWTPGMTGSAPTDRWN